MNASYFHSPVESFTLSDGFHKSLPQGHYLFMHNNGPDLVYDLHTYSSLFVKLLQVKPALAVLVHDSLGNYIPDAEVLLNGRKATYPLQKSFLATEPLVLKRRASSRFTLLLTRLHGTEPRIQ